TTGEIISSVPVNCSREELIAALKSFEGKISQIPPMYSAIKQDGKKLYELARKGQTVERKPREIEIYSITLLGEKEDGDAFLEVVCSKGTYIRTLCADIGERLGGDACMSYLRRTAAGAYDIKDAHSMEEIISAAEEGRQESLLLSLDSMFPDAGKITVTGRNEKKVRNGNSLFMKDLPDGEYRIYGEDGEFLALGESKGCEISIIKSFFEVL
ncbi:MAG: pseudouridine synthase, partial [Oscillospiraceae bacterium]|nr:pseudouridine synthase [Oscillospiraceae bacterium]